MQTSLLFIPFPHSNGSTNDDNGFNQLFQGEAQKIMELSRSTKMKGGTLSSFRPYIKSLSTRRGSQIQSVWSDPFNQNNCVPSQTVEVEIIGTIWNYIAGIHTKLLQENSSDIQCLKTMRADFEEINACNAAFGEILSSKVQHQFFTSHLLHFMKLYQNYICSYWQLSCISTTNRSDLIPSISSRCLEDIKACENYCSQLHYTAKCYMLPAIESIRSYIEGYAHYRLSFISLENKQYGIAISHLQGGIQIIKSRKNQTAQSAQAINSANQFILNALEGEFNRLRPSFSSISVPPGIPSLPPPCQPPNVSTASSLLCFPNEINSITVTQPNMVTNSYSNIPNMQIPNQSQNYATYNQAANIPYPYAPPKVSYPTIEPAFPQEPQPSKTHQTPKKNLGSINIKEWEIVCALKKELLPRIKKAVSNTNPTVSNVAKTLLSQYQAASDIDIQIQESIDNCQSDPSISSDTVNPYIKQADVFYTQLEERLNILERTKK